jgi:starch phosphorylase
VEADFRRRLLHLANNLWWSWQPDARTLLAGLDRDLWHRVDRNPIGFLEKVDDAQLAEAARDPRILAQIARLEQGLGDYLAGGHPWAEEHEPGLLAQPVAYFSPEFGIHDSLQVYSGGLGILAGDHVKSCSDQGIPMVAVGLLYREGYFAQSIDADGNQVETYREVDPDRLPIERVLDAEGRPVSIDIPVDRAHATADLWRATIGRCPLLLLDLRHTTKANYPQAFRLYGGGAEDRIFQEIVLGIGGYRALRAVGVQPGVMHLNEGHSAFATLEATAERMEVTGQNFAEASVRVAASVVFTTHTPVEAGHDRFDPGLVLHHLEPLRERLQLDEHGFLALGRVNPDDPGEPFCMTTLAIKLSNVRNGVSSLHGAVSRRMWQGLWPERPLAEVPIGHVTNGVHVPTWLAPELGQLYSDCLGEGWRGRASEPATWQNIRHLDATRLWEVKTALKHRLFDHIGRVLADRAETLGLKEPLPVLRPECLTIGFARRFASYKRSLLFFDDLERTRRLLTDPERPVQIIIAGKAHPADEPGKALLRRLVEISREPDLRNHVVIVPGYSMTLSRLMVEGCDLWLNTPRRPLEACGTSGMKAAVNGTLNCSTLDGWWDEAWDTRNGFAIGPRMAHVDAAEQDRVDAVSVMEVLADEVVPLFYDRDDDGVPVAWLERVKHALRTLVWRYNSDRMVRDYARLAYSRAAATTTSELRL